MATESLGMGTTSRFDVLTLKDGMTIEELKQSLAALDPRGKIHIADVQRIAKDQLRYPIEIAGRKL